MANPKVVFKAVSVLAASFGREATELTYEAYRLGLADLTDEQVNAACGRAVRECEFMPPPAVLRKLAGCQSQADLPALAWQDFMRATTLGPYRHVDFADRAINATVRNLGGWVQMFDRLTDAESEKWLRKEFLDAYEVLARRECGGEEGAPLRGLLEVERDAKGKMVDPTPIKIRASYSVAARIGATKQALIGVKTA